MDLLKIHTWILFLAIVIPSFAWGTENEIKIGAWELSPVEDTVWYRSHGEVVYGHEFGFVKTRDHCTQDHIMLVLTASDKAVKKYKGEQVEFGVVAGKERRTIPISYVSAEEWNRHLIVMKFTNAEVTEDFMSLMSRNPYVEVQLVKPNELRKLMYVEVEKFFLDGFLGARQKAKELCEHLK
jgi:hypothetical protein